MPSARFPKVGLILGANYLTDGQIRSPGDGTVHVNKELVILDEDMHFKNQPIHIFIPRLASRRRKVKANLIIATAQSGICSSK